MVTPYTRCKDDDLSTEMVINILKDSEKADKSVCHLPPVNPKGGDVFLFLPRDKDSKDDWKCDQLFWRNYGCKILATTPVIVKSYYVFVNPDGSNETTFKRFSYRLTEDDKHATVIYYKGDHNVTKKYTTMKKQTCASVRREIEKQEQSPSVVYKKSICKSVPQEYQAVLCPRNPKQVCNLQSKQRQKLRLSHDALYNLHELCYDLETFVQKIVTHPDLIVICGLNPMLKNVNRLLSITDGHLQHLLSYDTTFQLGDFYVSPLLFRNVLFSKFPIMPVAFLVHERKLRYCHEEMFRVIAKELPSLVNGSQMIPMVTDDEKAFDIIESHLPKVRRLLCWNHIINGAKLWLRQHGATSSELPVYVSDIRDLLHQESASEYVNQLDILKQKWSESFYNHYMNELDQKIKSMCTRWNLEEFGVYNPLSGITNNQSEGFNSVLKRMQQWKEMPIDSAVLSLYHLQAFYWNEWQRGLAGLGGYVFALREYQNLYKIPVDEIHLISSISLEDIGKKYKEGENFKQDENMQLLLDEDLKSNDKISDLTSDETEISNGNSQMTRARMLLKRGSLSHDPKMGTFTVKGSLDKPYVVRLYPKQFCSCPATSQCYHIVAVQLSLGMDINQEKKKVNLSELKRNTKNKGRKKSGRKRPTPDDYDIEPAPDSLAKKIHLDTIIPKIHENLPTASEEDKSGEQSCPGNNPTSMEVTVPVTHTPKAVVFCNSATTSGKAKRKRCGSCKNCLSDDCGKCKYCLDKPKFGGNGRLRQSCVNKKCQQMISSKGCDNEKKLHVHEVHVKTQDKHDGCSASSPIVVDKISERNDQPRSCTREYLATSPFAPIEVCDFATVYRGQWLNDQVINYSLYFIYHEKCTPKLASDYVYCVVPSYVFTKLMAGQADETLDSYFRNYDLMKVDAIIMPCNLCNHWILIVIWPNEKSILVYDSIGGYLPRTTKAINLLGMYLKKAFDSKNDLFNFQEYQHVEEVVPKQKNLIDCGVFLCRFAYHLATSTTSSLNYIKTDSKSMRQWLISLIIESFRVETFLRRIDKGLVYVAEREILSSGYLPILNNYSSEQTLGEDFITNEDNNNTDNLDELLQKESLEVIQKEYLLVPTFINSNDYPDDICDLPYGYDTYIRDYPKLLRPERTQVLFQRDFIRSTVKSLEEKVRHLYLNPNEGLFWNEGEFLKKHDIGGTNFWPVEYFDMGLEILYYLLGLECDIRKVCVPVLSTTMKTIVIAEILTHLTAKKFDLELSDAKHIIKAQKLNP